METINTPSEFMPNNEPTIPTIQQEKFYFTGTGREYFGIWIVNLFLTLITLGIYTAWAKVRRTRYFYEHTYIAGSNFEYHGNPTKILIGRLLVVAIFIAYKIELHLNPIVGAVLFTIPSLVLPILLWKSLQFKLSNSSYRGIRFAFDGSAKKFYAFYFLSPIVAFILTPIIVPFLHHKIKQFEINSSRFGTTYFSFKSIIGKFYKIYFIGFLILLTIASLMFFTVHHLLGSQTLPKNTILAIMLFMVILLLCIWILFIYPLLSVLFKNAIWNTTTLGKHQFKSNMKLSKATFITVTNIIGIVLSFGLFTPFAQIRWMKYRIESMSLIVHDNLDDFIAGTTVQTSAFAESASDFLNIDIAL